MLAVSVLGIPEFASPSLCSSLKQLGNYRAATRSSPHIKLSIKPEQVALYKLRLKKLEAETDAPAS